MRNVFILLLILCSIAAAQNTVGVLEGTIKDPASASVSGAEITLKNVQTGLAMTEHSTNEGHFRFSDIPVGEYELTVTANGFATYTISSIRVDVDRDLRLPIALQIASAHSEVDVTANASLDMGTALGNVVSSREATDLPLNGRNFTQLGLLQPGVAPMTSGLLQAGGIVRSQQAYGVNGQAPESNNYLLDGMTNVDNVNGAFAIRTPVDAISEFRVLTLNAPAEYGSTAGATTTVVTKSGTNNYHGDLYEFIRNDAFDARNFFAANTEPLHQNQFGATIGGPIRKNKDFFFAYYEGFRNVQGETQAAIVPTAAQRTGDFSGLVDPATGQPVPLINEFTGQQFPNNTIPSFLLNPIALNAEKLIPLPNIGTNVYSTTQNLNQTYDQGGARFDHYFGNGDRFLARYAGSSLSAKDPLPINGAGVPGFPVANSILTNSFTVSETHAFSPSTVQTIQLSFFRNVFFYGQATNHTPGSDLGFEYQPTLAANSGTPYMIISGYTQIGNPITGPQNTYQNDYAGSYSLSTTRGSHSLKFGGGLDRQQINLILGIATNGFFVFAPFPISDSFGSFLVGQPVQFFQGGGDFNRGLRKWIGSIYAQDEWRLTPHLTLNYGLRWEVNTPYTDIRNRMNAWAPGQQSKVMPTAPAGLLFPGDPGIPDGIAAIDWKQLMPRIGLAWDPLGSGKTVMRAGYGIFYDGFTNGVGGPLQAPVSALPWTEAYQLPGPGLNFADPYNGAVPPFVNQQFVKPATILTIQSGMVPPYVQNWYFSVQQSIAGKYVLDIRYVGAKGTHIPRFIEANPAIYGPGATPQNADQRRLYAGCPADGGPCTFASVGLIADEAVSSYNALQVSIQRQFTKNFSFLASYWLSKSLDDISSLNVSGSAPTMVAGETDLAQNPFDLKAEYGPSLFDARNRFVFSGTYALPTWNVSRGLGVLVNGWQFNTIVNLASGTPFTVYDSANVSLQGSAPEITGFFSSRPNVISDPNAGPHTPSQWVSRSAFQQLNPVTQAGQFGNEGRNLVRGPGIEAVDLSLFKDFSLGERARLQFRAECFNVLNHPNLGLPVNDLQSPAFGQILQSGQPRLFQFALKFLF